LAEGLLVASRLGVEPAPFSSVQAALAEVQRVCRQTAHNRCSMLGDLERNLAGEGDTKRGRVVGRASQRASPPVPATEARAINGYIVSAAARLGIGTQVPTNRRLVGLVESLERLREEEEEGEKEGEQEGEQEEEEEEEEKGGGGVAGRRGEMQVVETVSGMVTTRRLWAAGGAGGGAGIRVGLVATMGFLHEGHLALVRQAVEECDRVVVSIFLNPAQFAPSEDFGSYPESLAADLKLLRAAGVDVCFAPAAAEMYPSRGPGQVGVEGLGTTVSVGAVEGQAAEAAARPGFFTGVATVVAFHLTNF